MGKANPYTYLRAKYKIYSTQKFNAIQKAYDSPKAFEEAFANNPYWMAICYLNKTFNLADELILELFPKLKATPTRCLWYINNLLKKNESYGDTCIEAKYIYDTLSSEAPELSEFVFDVITTNNMFHYDKKTKVVALRGTYENECLIAANIKSRILSPKLTPMNWEKYTIMDGMDLTDEQMQVLRLACEKSVFMVNGAAGCVDCDTEFFNGEQWKKISEYNENDKVLQYNNDGTAELVKPISYIKQKCDTLWHFETKYGINQTICDQHNIVYWSPKGTQHECHIRDILNTPNKTGWRGRFKTAFSYDGEGINLSDNEIRVMCAVICDGSFQNSSTTNYCRFHLKKDRKKQRLKELCKQANIEIIEKPSVAEGYNDYFLMAPIRTKVFDSTWYKCSNHQLNIICDEIMFWDGSIDTTTKGIVRKRFSTTIKQTADFVQFAYSACGYRASIYTHNRKGQDYLTNGKLYTRKSIEYSVCVTNRTMIGICQDNRSNHTKTKIEQVPTRDGYKYCFTVPSHMLILRRENCIFITGNCGKTSCVQALVKMLDDNGYGVTLLAPTGIAAKRLKEVTGHHASTIHKHLYSGASFGDFLIVDEMSMVGVHLLAMLLEEVPEDTKIIFICDEAQLASISCGNIVKDIIDSGVMPIVHLTKVFRFGIGGIATATTNIRTGAGLRDMKQFDDYTFIPVGKKPLEQVLDNYDAMLHKYGKDEVMVLSPFNVRELGTYAINKAIQDKYNSNPVLFEYKRQGYTISFKAGSMCLNTENNYDVTSEGGSLAVMNGEKGTLLNYDGSTFTCEFENGVALLEKGDMYKILLGEAMSIHKSQGNQAKAVIVILDKSHDFALNRNIIYVAASRAQKELIIIGDMDTIDHALTIQQENQRQTYLKELLK